MSFVANAFAQHRQNARLADAGLSRQQRDLTLAVGGAAPEVGEQRDLLLAANERRHCLRARRLEPADVLDLANDRPGGNRSLEALQIQRPQRLQFKCSAKQPSRRFGDHDAAGLGEGLQPRGEIRRIPDDAPLARLAFADQFAHHDQAG